MAEFTVKGAVWRNLTPPQARLVIDLLLGSTDPAVDVEITRPYEQRIGRSEWDVEVTGVSLGLVQDVDAELRAAPRG